MNRHTDALWDQAHAFMPYPASPVAHAATGPLSGLSFAAKDIYHVKGYPTSGGQPLLMAVWGVQDRTAPVVQSLLDAGARFVGKTVTDELAFSMNGQNAHFGAPINGAVAERISGGSSSGSASAVSNRLCDFALGSDTGGSVRAPANHCGLVGMRPSQGRISLQDTMALSPSLDTCGWFARDVPTFARVAQVLLGDDAQPLPDHIRLLAPTDMWALATPGALKALKPVRQQAEQCLGKAKPVRIMQDDMDTMYWHFRAIQGREAWDVHGGFLQRFQPVLGAAVAQRFDWSSKVSDEQVAKALRYIWDHLDHPLTVDEIAGHVGVSRATLGRLFRKHMRRSIIDEIASNRLEKARELLALGKLPVKEVAVACGFSTPNYFNNVFRKATGATPRKFRLATAKNRTSSFT